MQHLTFHNLPLHFPAPSSTSASPFLRHLRKVPKAALRKYLSWQFLVPSPIMTRSWPRQVIPRVNADEFLSQLCCWTSMLEVDVGRPFRHDDAYVEVHISDPHQESEALNADQRDK